MLHYIDKDLKGKIELLRTKFPSERAFASEVKVANTTLRAWLNAGYAIRDDAFARLVKSMVRHGIISNEEGVKLITEKRAPITSNAVPVSVDKIPQFPIISDAAAAECNPCYMPIADYAETNSEGTVGFSEGKPGDFVLRITGNSMLPWYPEGTLVLARPNQLLHNGDRVIAVLNSGEVIFKIFAEHGNCF